MDSIEKYAEHCNCKTHGEYISKGFVIPAFGDRMPKLIWSGCNDCALDAERKEESLKKREEARNRQLRIEEKLRRSGIPKRFLGISLQKIVPRQEQQKIALYKAILFFEKIKSHPSEDFNVVFSGAPMSGKSHFAAAIALAVINNFGTAFFASAKEIALMIRARWSDPNAIGEQEALKMLSMFDLLVIDDVGSTRLYKYELDSLYSVIDGRFNDLKPTIVTTIADKDGFKFAIGEHNYRRLCAGGRWIKL